MDYLARVMDLAWFTVTAVSVILLLLLEIHRRQKRECIHRALAVLLALFVLIPSLSIRDDMMGLAFLSQRASQRDQPALESQAGSDFQFGIHPLGFDHSLVASIHSASIDFGFLIWVPTANLLITELGTLRQAGRAPPTS